MAWLHIRYHSEVLRMPAAMEVLLPQAGSADSRGQCGPGPYAALYLLHGVHEDHTAWLRRSNIERYVRGLPLAVVMPAGHHGWHTDMAYGRDYFRFLTEELPALCERMFPLSSSREDRYIAGASMGGYGALKAALAAPETFGAAASFSGPTDVLGVYDRLDSALAADIFGSRSGLPGSAGDLFAAAEKLAGAEKPRADFYLWCGKEEPLYPENLRFCRHLQELGLPLTFAEGEGESWDAWDRCVRDFLQWLRRSRKDGREGSAWLRSKRIFTPKSSPWTRK